MRYLAATLLALLAFAPPAFATSVTDVSADNSLPSRAAGARTSFVVGFKAPGGVANADKILVTFPNGTTFNGWSDGTVEVGATQVGSCASPVNSVSQCSLYSTRTIAAGETVKVTLNGVTNPGNGANTLSVATTADADPATAPFTVVAAGQLTQITLDNASPSSAAGARTRYVASFKVSDTGGLSAQANSRIDVFFPPSTGYTGWTGGEVSVGGTVVGSCSAPSNGAVQCSLYNGRTIAAGATVQLALDGITNTTDPGSRTVSVDTTSDPALLPSAPFEVLAPHEVTGVTLALANPSSAAGARTTYVAGFTTSATGGLSSAANSRLSITFPDGTTFTGWTGGVVSAGGAAVGSCSAPSGLGVECSLYNGRAIAASTAVTLTFTGVTNSGTPGAKQVSVATTSDTPVVDSTSATVVATGALGSITVANGAPTAAVGARTRYVVGFTLSATGGLSEAANSRIDVAFPSDTTFPGWTGGTVTVGTTAVGGCSSPNVLAVQCSLYSGRAIAAGADVTIVFTGVTNPTKPGIDKLVAVSTTSDPKAQASAAYAVSGANPVTGVSVAAGSLTPAARTRYVVRFAASATGALAQEANSRIDLGLPAGTTFPGWTGGSVHDETAGVDVGSCSSPNGLAIQCSLYSGRTVAAGHVVRIVFENITNPATDGPYGLILSTTSDPGAVKSPPYAQGDTVPPETAIVTDAVEGAIATFDFASETGATFECSLDDGPFEACVAPYRTPELAAGTHTFSVRAVDADGNRDPAPARRSFTVGGPTPVPTTSPDPTPTAVPTATATATPAPTVTPAPTAVPTPEYKQDVVAAPASGTIEVCAKPGSGCHRLALGEAVPLNRTIDARKGVVVLTSIGADGKLHSAKFSEGMFKISQSAATTDLTLNEPLAPCASKKARSSAKKPKTRKLWGDGKGKFRTKGSYSAATVRGTKWLVQDTCSSTLTRVTAGVVSVRDQVKGKTITLRAGKRYTAKRR